ncbi:MAG TPA: hypothetical protein VLJ39_20245 [Tepidisphaeraceae bacterium]|jgi:hypothetical protein|nr:hypothetical protein [Tepidisphaeraceae bacterium]
MTIKGTVRGGVIIPEAGSDLAEGTEVVIDTLPADEHDLDQAYEDLRAELRRRVEIRDAGEGKFCDAATVLARIEQLRRARRSQSA